MIARNGVYLTAYVGGEHFTLRHSLLNVLTAATAMSLSLLNASPEQESSLINVSGSLYKIISLWLPKDSPVPTQISSKWQQISFSENNNTILLVATYNFHLLVASLLLILACPFRTYVRACTFSQRRTTNRHNDQLHWTHQKISTCSPRHHCHVLQPCSPVIQPEIICLLHKLQTLFSNCLIHIPDGVKHPVFVLERS